MPMVTCFWKCHVLGDMFCIQGSGCDVTNVCDRGARIGELVPRGVNQLQSQNLKIAKQFHTKEIIRLYL